MQLAGYQVIIIAPYESDEERENIQVLSVDPPKNRFSRMVIFPFRLVKKALEVSADIYHIHDPDLLLIAYLIKSLTHSKVIYDVHENYSEVIKSRSWLPVFCRPFLSRCFARFEKRIAKTLDGIVAVTEDIQQLFDGQTSVLVRNYPLIELMEGHQKPIKRKKPKEPIRLIYAGDLTKVRGIIEIVRSLEYVKSDLHLEFVLIGGFSEKGLEESLKRLKGYSRVNHLGRIPYLQVSEQLFKADIGLVCLHPLPRYRKALPVKMFEYMASGLPVIASDFPAWKIILEENQCGLVVDPKSPVSIGEAIQVLAENPEQRRRMGMNGKKAVEEKFNWSTEGERLLRFYDDLLRG